ncbi:hypothetical protein JVU11DRAFT_4482 [Chiua virens]|nr:hypothetical protein JVU11DRAFT_4482 [Chiua virens]
MSDSLERLTSALQEFYQHKDTVIQYGPRDGWGIPKLKLLQSVVPGIRQSGMAMPWTTDITKHAHVEEIKVPAHTSNNQNYYSQIACHLDRLDKCFCFNLATYIEEHHLRDQEVDNSVDDNDNNKDHEPDSEMLASAAGFSTPGRLIIDYFSISSALV